MRRDNNRGCSARSLTMPKWPARRALAVPIALLALSVSDGCVYRKPHPAC